MFILCFQEEAKTEAIDAMYNDMLNKQLLLNIEFKTGNVEYVTLSLPDSNDDIIQALIQDGFILAEQRKEKRLVKLVSAYRSAQEKAKASRVCIIDPVFM